jgi:thiamine biosynthesis lipoprotein
MRRSGALLAAAVLACVCASFGCQTAAREEQVTIRGEALGTSYSIKLIGPRGALNETALAQAAKEELDRVDALMSTYRDDSELMRLNRAAADEWFPVSEETLEVLQIAQQVFRETDGCFDPTVGPLVRLWNFGPGRTPTFEPPAEEAIEAARARVGFDKITLRAEPPAVKKKRADVELDLSAVAKGYVVDRIALRLETAGVARMMVEVGGEVRTAGTAGGDNPWRIGIETPQSVGRSVQQVVPLVNHSLATSGDYRNYYEKDGVRYSHTIDPRTGRPVTHHLASVTVLHENCATADALATGLLAMGPQAASALAEQDKLPVLLLSRSGAEITAQTSAAWDAHLRADASPETHP